MWSGRGQRETEAANLNTSSTPPPHRVCSCFARGRPLAAGLPGHPSKSIIQHQRDQVHVLTTPKWEMQRNNIRGVLRVRKVLLCGRASK